MVPEKYAEDGSLTFPPLSSLFFFPFLVLQKKIAGASGEELDKTLSSPPFFSFFPHKEFIFGIGLK